MATWLYVLAIKELIFNFLNFLLMDRKVHLVYMHADEAIIPVTVTLINYNHTASNLFVSLSILCQFCSQTLLGQVCLARDLATEVCIFTLNLYTSPKLLPIRQTPHSSPAHKHVRQGSEEHGHKARIIFHKWRENENT